MADERTLPVPRRRPRGPLPSGTVTFLFTDIAGSTQLLWKGRQAYAAALADHRRMLRAAVAAHGGREVDTQGDAFFMVFPSASQAVAAAAEGQRSLATHSWPDGLQTTVRMGLHSGEATVAGESYIGLAVHRAARIMAAGSGGQVLLSEATAALVADDLPTGTALRSLGGHPLKDFPGAAPLFQLDVEGLRTRFPPLHQTGPRRRLPESPGSLFGREKDIAALSAMLTDPPTRLITVTGPGGVGKTRLAAQTARTVADNFPGGAVFVPLSAIADPALVLSTLADGVGVRGEPGMDLVEGMRAALGRDRTLVVLDNFEHVVGAAADLAVVLEEIPALVALVTSRQALRLSPEQQYPLAPLADTPAERLFAERAAAVRPGFALDTLDVANARAVTEICRRLDGLPLAIELAAARIRLLPPAVLLERLGQRLDVLGSGPIDLPERQRTLRATMDWSFGLLGPQEQALFTRLAVFSGGFTVTAAETVCVRPGESDVLDTLSVLLDASLLTESPQPGAEARLDMLATVRAYAAEKLASSSDRTETERRHTAWLLALTDHFVVAGDREFGEALARLDRERANFRAAVQRAIDRGDLETATLLIRNTVSYLSRRVAEREAWGWLNQMHAQAGTAAPAVRGRLLILRGLFARAVGEATAIRPLLEEGRRLLPDDADHALDRTLMAFAGIFAALADGSIEEASRCIDEMAARSAATGRRVGAAVAEMLRGNIALVGGDLAGADRHYETGLELSGRLGDEALVGQLLSLRGLILLATGKLDAARRSVLDGVAVNRNSSHQQLGITYSLEALAALALADGHPAVAARALAAAAAARRIVDEPLGPALGPLGDDLTAQAHEQLGDQAFETASAEGRQWSLPQALDRTLEDLSDQDRPWDAARPTLRSAWPDPAP
ncbi:MAG TPA: adenylate/guanylate cyclase domain-containing protein [Blastococcus sp.]|nr:adenylate/guanylate cyclase domain-containing protein [Blastococcus sp.]